MIFLGFPRVVDTDTHDRTKYVCHCIPAYDLLQKFINTGNFVYYAMRHEPMVSYDNRDYTDFPLKITWNKLRLKSIERTKYKRRFM